MIVTTYQAISGAGKTFKDWPEMLGNIIPFIGGEEEKSEQEPLTRSRKSGKWRDRKSRASEDHMSVCACSCIKRTYCRRYFINFEKKPTKEQLIEKLANFKGFPQEAELPSAPKQFIQYLEEENQSAGNGRRRL